MKCKTIQLASIAVVVATWSTASSVFGLPIPGLFNTGVDNSGAPLPDGTVDPHWVLTAGPSGTPTAIASNPRPGSWVPNTATSRWVTPLSNGSFSVPGGTYTYDLTFNLTGFNPATASISGIWASDNQSSVLLNGVPFASHAGGSSAFLSFDSFGTGAGFLPGVNTLTIQVTNISGPSGAHVSELRGDALLIPEPAGATLVALGGLFVFRRRSRLPLV